MVVEGNAPNTIEAVNDAMESSRFCIPRCVSRTALK
jgi:hypothetical protein